jgi:hypothetical protein
MEYKEYVVIGIKESKSKYANVDLKGDIIKANNIEEAVNKFKKKYPRYTVFGSRLNSSYSDEVWFNKNIEEQFKNMKRKI